MQSVIDFGNEEHLFKSKDNGKQAILIDGDDTVGENLNFGNTECFGIENFYNFLYGFTQVRTLQYGDTFYCSCTYVSYTHNSIRFKVTIVEILNLGTEFKFNNLIFCISEYRKSIQQLILQTS